MKKTSKEIAALLADLKVFSTDPRARKGLSKHWQNSHKKFVGLRKHGPRYFLAAGPMQEAHAFRVVDAKGMIQLHDCTMASLAFQDCR